MYPLVKQLSITFVLVLYLIVQQACTPVYAAQAITPVQWQQLTSDKAFGYKNDIESVAPPEEYKVSAYERAIMAFFKFWGTREGNILLWIIIITVIGYIAYRAFFRKDSFLFAKDKKMMGAETGGNEDERDLANTNWETLLHSAVHNNDYRLAVRYSYMWMLQIMQQRELIKYRIDKTNYEYATELNETAYKQPFKQLSRQYEYAWYGRFDLSHSAYNQYKDVFDNIRKQMGA